MAIKLIELTRGPIVECIHNGDIAVVDFHGNLLYSAGDPYKITYMRSSAKPLQALYVLLSGTATRYGFSNREIAIMCASHHAEIFHRETVLSILNKIGLSESNLLGGSVTSLNANYALELARNQIPPSPVFSDCSGKHSGMLATAMHNGYSIHNYLDEHHPVQKDIKRVLSSLCNYPEAKIQIGIDGCSAPVHALPLYNAALGYAQLAKPDLLPQKYQAAADRIFDSMCSYPEMVSGTAGFCTKLMHATKGKLIGKIGAQGVYCIGLKKQGWGISIKMECGTLEAIPPTVIHTLKLLNVLTEQELQELRQYELQEKKNDSDKVVGYYLPQFQLTRTLSPTRIL